MFFAVLAQQIQRCVVSLVDSLHVGDHVVAIGSPLGLEGSASDGIVSALRDVSKTKWIQTTAPVSHGNSGGPLLDMKDKVVGVITWGVNLQLGETLIKLSAFHKRSS